MKQRDTVETQIIRSENVFGGSHVVPVKNEENEKEEDPALHARQHVV